MEDKKEGLIIGMILDGQGGGREISLEEASRWVPDQGVLWLHFNYSKSDARQWLRQHAQIHAAMLKTLIAPETRPRCLFQERGTLISLRGVNLNPGQDPEDMVSLRLWVEPSRIISTRKRRVLSIKDIVKALEKGEGPRNAGEFMVLLNEKLIQRMSDTFEAMQDKVDALEEAVAYRHDESLRTEIAEVRREIILLRRYLSPQRDALTALASGPCPWLTDEHRTHLREAGDKIVRHLEDLDASRDRAGIVFEEISHRLTEQLNRRMYVLSVVTIIFMPITFITGALGMNVNGIPGSSVGHGFAMAMGLITFIGLLILAILYKKKWI